MKSIQRVVKFDRPRSLRITVNAKHLPPPFRQRCIDRPPIGLLPALRTVVVAQTFQIFRLPF